MVRKANINKKLKSNGEKITSSGNELFMKRENSIDICIEDMNLEAENIELSFIEKILKENGDDFKIKFARHTGKRLDD